MFLMLEIQQWEMFQIEFITERSNKTDDIFHYAFFSFGLKPVDVLNL